MGTVELVPWPNESGRRTTLERSGRPRILILQGGVTAPVCGPLEDWVRPPISRQDLEARVAALQARAGMAPMITDRLLDVGGNTLTLTEGESRLIGLLVERFGEIVSRDDMYRRLWADCPQPQRNALDLRVLRLRRRLEPLGLTVRTVWGRGYLLAHTSDGTEKRVAV